MDSLAQTLLLLEGCLPLVAYETYNIWKNDSLCQGSYVFLLSIGLIQNIYLYHQSINLNKNIFILSFSMSKS